MTKRKVHRNGNLEKEITNGRAASGLKWLDKWNEILKEKIYKWIYILEA